MISCQHLKLESKDLLQEHLNPIVSADPNLIAPNEIDGDVAQCDPALNQQHQPPNQAVGKSSNSSFGAWGLRLNFWDMQHSITLAIYYLHFWELDVLFQNQPENCCPCNSMPGWWWWWRRRRWWCDDDDDEGDDDDDDVDDDDDAGENWN